MSRAPYRFAVAIAGTILALTWLPGAAAPQWLAIGNDEGSLARRGAVYALATDPARPDRLYVAVGNQLFLSLDGGGHFSMLPPVPTSSRIRALAVLRDPTQAATPAPPRLLVGLESGGVLASSDGGKTFIRGELPGTESPFPFPVWWIHAVPGSPGVAYLEGGFDLYRTDDGGAHWLRMDTPSRVGSPELNLAVSPDGHAVYLGSAGGLHKSVDGGASWVPLGGGLPPAPYHSPALPGADPDVAGRVFVIVADFGTYRSSDGGTSWARTGPTPVSCLYSMLVHEETLWALNEVQMCRSRDGGKTWEILPLPPNLQYQAVARDASTGRLYVGAATTWEPIAGVWRSGDDGDSWVADSRGMGGATVDSLIADPGRALFAVTYRKLHGMLGTQETWSDITPFGGSMQTNLPSPVIVRGPGRLMTSGPMFARSDDDGVTWYQVPRTTTSGNSIKVLASEPGVPEIVYGREDQLAFSGYQQYLVAALPRQSSDGGLTWSPIDKGLPKITNRLVATGSGRLLADADDALWFSADTGFNWTRVAGIPGPIRDIRVRPDRAAMVMVATGAGLYRSDDGGATFVRVGALPDPEARYIAIDWHTERDVYMVSPTGNVFASSDGGATWLALGGEASFGGPSTYGDSYGGRAPFSDVALSPWSTATLYAATSRGVLKFVALPDVALAEEYYHPGFDHYFLTASTEEAATLAIGAVPPWRPTGRSFSVWDTGNPALDPVCRFFSATFAPKSSHFYTPFASECAELRSGSAWVDEGTAFYLQLPQGTPGARGCPGGAQPLYRAYNAFMGGAPNHRYTTEASLLDTMLAQGWIMEGEASTRVFACVPAQR